MSDWLELELGRSLSPVKAPQGLWERVERGRRTPAPRRTRNWWAMLPVAAATALALALSVGAGAVWLATLRGAPLDLRQLAAEEGRSPARLELYSQDPRQIRLWLRDHAGLDVPLAWAPAVRLEGARTLRRGGRRIGAVVYRIGDDEATLLVARADPGCALPAHGSGGAAWRAQDQVYALACSNPARSQAACLLCHANL